jgi:hypothetical protein
MSESADLSIIIVNWRSVDFLRKCLTSIRAHGHGLTLETIVVDNASFDGSAEMVAREFPETCFIQSDKNIGFGKANNLGFSRSNGRNLLFLNPDTEILGTALPVMVSTLESVPGAGAVGCKLLNDDGSIQMSCIQAFPSILNFVLDADYLRAAFPRFSVWGTRPLLDGSTGPAPVEVISGACLMIRRDVFEKLGGFSTEYFMYAEDTDLCYRVRRAGWTAYYTGQAEVIHHGGKSSSSAEQSQFASVVMLESILRFMRLFHGRAYAWAFQATAALVAAFRLLMLGVARLATVGQEKSRAVSAAWAKWAKIFRWALGREAWVKQLD